MTLRETQTQVLKAVDGALRLSAPFLATDPGRLPGQLTGRLVGSSEPGIGRFLDDVRGHAPRPWLCPLTPALAQAGGSLERILFGTTEPMWAVAVTPDGTRIVSGADDGTVRIWNIASGHLERTLESHGGRVCAVAVTPDGAGIVSDAGGYRDFTVRIWNLASGRLERALEGYSRDGNAVAVTPYGHRIVTGSIDGKVSVLDLASGREIASWAPDPGIEFETCCTVPTDPALVVYSDSAGGIHILRLLEA